MSNDTVSPEPSPRANRATRPVKRSFSIRGHRTSISLEAAFWEALGEIAAAQNKPLAQLVADVDGTRGAAGLSSAVRIFILDHFREQRRISAE